MLFDTHVHTKFSPDGNSDMNEYITLLDEGKLAGIGFTEHLDFLPECGAFGFFDYASYVKRINGFKEKGYLLFIGAEVDYSHIVEEKIIANLKEDTYDYTICSVHMAGGLSFSSKDDIAKLQDVNNLEKIIEGYHYEIISGLKVAELDVIGHIGIFTRHLSSEYFSHHPLKSRMEEIFDDIAKECALSGKIIEVNTSGLFAAVKSTIPDRSFLTAYYNYGGRSISIGSDAHCVEHAGRGFNEAISLIKEIGFKYILLPWNKEKPIYV